MKVFFYLAILFAGEVLARPIEIRVRDYGWLTSVPVAKDALDSYLNGVEDDINEEQPILDPRRVNYGTANSSVLAAKGLGTDYVNTPRTYEVSLGLGVAWDEERDVAIRDEISGAALASGLSLGVRMDQLLQKNFLGLDRKRLMGYLSFGNFRGGKSLPGRDIDIAGKIEATNLSLHLRYELIGKSGSDFWGWGGVKIHTGYEFNRNKVSFSTTLDEPVSLDTGGSGTLAGRLTGKPTFDVETTTHSFPLEISSNILFLNIFSFYAGLGTDLNLGLSKGKGKTKGDFSTLACTSGVCVGETVLPQLEAQANYDAQSQVRNITFRGFAGFQLDLPGGLHGYIQGTQMLGTKVIGASAGLRFVH
jgi:hypothetical protein